MNLNRITKSFDRAYQSNKKSQETLKTRQQKMFAAFSTAASQAPLARQVVDIPADVDPWQYVSKNHPGWILVDQSDRHGHAVIEENPAFKKFTWINPETGRVYGRTVAEGSPTLDDERLQVENPNLWERVSFWPEPWWSLVRGAIAAQVSLPWSAKALDDAADSYLRDCNVQRVIKDPATLGDTELSELQPYLSPGPLTVRLVPPRDAKPEELEEVNG